jgi:hypothetical protein
MKPVRTRGTNHGWGAPRGQEDEIGMLPSTRRETDGGVVYYSTWEFDPWERKAISEGQNIELGVTWIGAMPPVSLGVTPANRENGGILE